MPRNDKRHFYPKPDARGGEGLWLYGLHAVRAALANPARKTKRIVLTSRAAEEIGPKLLGRVRQEIADGDTVSRLLPAGAVHQGVALQCDPLPGRDLDDVLDASSRQRGASSSSSTRSPIRRTPARSCAPPRRSASRR